MASTPIKTGTVAISLVLVLATELLAWQLITWWEVPPLLAVGLVRIVQVAAIVAILIKWDQGVTAIGWAPSQWLDGLRKGAIWSLAFAAVAGVGMLAVRLTGNNPLQMVRSPLPAGGWELGLFFLVGGFVAPVAEEFFFRGILYTFFRRWGFICALTASTALFAILHLPQGIPVTQIVGGLVFAVAYETTGNLMVPMTIHCLGNLAIFSLSLI